MRRNKLNKIPYGWRRGISFKLSLRTMIRKSKLTVLFLFCSLTIMAQAKFDMQGHRGCRGLMPENTIPAMKKALDLGVTTLEMDIAISQDKKPLLSHDPYMAADFVLMPTSQPISKAEEKNYKIYGLPYAEIRKFDVGSKPHPKFPRQQKMPAYKPLLADLIDSVEAYAQAKNKPAPFYNIETKTTPEGDHIFHPAPAEFVNLLMAVIREKGILERVTIQSFDPRTLEVVHRQFPSIKTALLIENTKGLENNLQRLSFKPTIYSPYFTLVTDKLVQECHARGLQIIPWTVNSKTAIDKFIKQKVDGIITDYPDLISKQ